MLMYISLFFHTQMWNVGISSKNYLSELLLHEVNYI